jgi:hypothetical protein
MGLRNWMNENQLLGGGIAAALVVLAIILVVWQMTHSTGNAPPPPLGTPDLTKAYYSDDDGKTFFADNVRKLTPFTRGGKNAVRAYVYKCGSTTIVGYLGRDTDAGQRTTDAAGLGSDERKVGALATQATLPPVFEVKKPGDSTWVPMARNNAAQWQTIIDVKCPGGSDLPVSLLPGQQ